MLTNGQRSFTKTQKSNLDNLHGSASYVTLLNPTFGFVQSKIEKLSNTEKKYNINNQLNHTILTYQMSSNRNDLTLIDLIKGLMPQSPTNLLDYRGFNQLCLLFPFYSKLYDLEVIDTNVNRCFQSK